MYTLCTKAPLLKRALLCVWACAHCAVVSHRGFVELQSAACAVCPYGETNSLGCGEGDTGAVTPGNVVVAAGHDIHFHNCTFQHLGACEYCANLPYPVALEQTHHHSRGR